MTYNAVRTHRLVVNSRVDNSAQEVNHAHQWTLYPFVLRIPVAVETVNRLAHAVRLKRLPRPKDTDVFPDFNGPPCRKECNAKITLAVNLRLYNMLQVNYLIHRRHESEEGRDITWNVIRC